MAALRQVLAAGDEPCVGATVYAATIVRPLQDGTNATVDAFLDGTRVKIVPVDCAIARRAAPLRAEQSSLRFPMRCPSRRL
jgi:hypothetical protein